MRDLRQLWGENRRKKTGEMDKLCTMRVGIEYIAERDRGGGGNSDMSKLRSI